MLFSAIEKYSITLKKPAGSLSVIPTMGKEQEKGGELE
jgi:hypothetical protein